jgi:hypothetical protein
VSIKNYTTTIDPLKTVGEMEIILAKHGVSRISKEYDGFGGVGALTFTIRLPGSESEVPFRLPINTEAVLKILQAESRKGKLRRSFVNEDQAKRIGWRILKDWVDAQLALVQIGMVSIQEVFMPYLYNYQTGKTLFQQVSGSGFQGFLLAAPTTED